MAGAGETALIAAGEIDTWMVRSFGGDAFVMMPSNYTMLPGQQPGLDAFQDPLNKRYYTCPYGYSMTLCPQCEGPKMRCRTEFNLIFRWAPHIHASYLCTETRARGKELPSKSSDLQLVITSAVALTGTIAIAGTSRQSTGLSPL